MASPPIKKPKTKTVPLGLPFNWDGLTEEEQIAFGTPDPAFVAMAQGQMTLEMTRLLNATLKETLEG